MEQKNENKTNLETLDARLKRIERNSNIQTFIVILGFIGLFSLSELIKKSKKIL